MTRIPAGLSYGYHSIQRAERDINNPDSKVNGANMGPFWDRQDPGGPHVGPMNFAIWVTFSNKKSDNKPIKVSIYGYIYIYIYQFEEIYIEIFTVCNSCMLAQTRV